MHYDYPGREFPRNFAPEGSTHCWIMTGDPDVPNGAMWFPKGHPRCAGISGDPHLKTFNRQRFDLQAAGEFIAAKSLDDELEVQVRLQPNSSTSAVSFATAVAARVGPHRVMIARSSGVPLRIDGDPVELADGYRLLINDGRSSVIRTRNRYSVVWPDGTNLHVDDFNTFVDVYILSAEARDGRLTGLLGNADGERNDFRTRDGKVLDSPPEFATLYKVFAESWRIRANDSLFHYEAGEGTDTFTLRDHPSRPFSVRDMDPAERARAEQRCRAAGVVEAEALADCIYDFGSTGDEEYITAALSRQIPPELRALFGPPEASAEPSGGIEIDLPSEGIAAHVIVVGLSGPVEDSYLFGFAPAGSPAGGVAVNPYRNTVLRAGADRVTLVVPAIPGDYELRYRQNGGDLDVVRRRPFRSVAPKLTIEAPPTVQSGGHIDVRVSGDVGESMAVYLVLAGSPDDTQGPTRGLRQGTSSGGAIGLQDMAPGEYEIRCISVSAGARQVYARRKLTIQ